MNLVERAPHEAERVRRAVPYVNREFENDEAHDSAANDAEARAIDQAMLSHPVDRQEQRERRADRHRTAAGARRRATASRAVLESCARDAPVRRRAWRNT